MCLPVHRVERSTLVGRRDNTLLDNPVDMVAVRLLLALKVVAVALVVLVVGQEVLQRLVALVEGARQGKEQEGRILLMVACIA
jgi:hypothetical protein